MAFRFLIFFVFSSLSIKIVLLQRPIPPEILQDSRLEPKVDGTFGFLYRTQDGITSAAKGDPTGVIQGRFSYTDPTGLKVNFNYNAGSRRAPGYVQDGPEDDGSYDPKKYENSQQNSVEAPAPRSYYSNPEPAYRPEPPRPVYTGEAQYQGPAITRPRYTNPSYQGPNRF